MPITQMYAMRYPKLNFALALLAMIVVSFIYSPIALADGGVSSGIDTILRSSSLEGDAEYRTTIAGYLHKPISFIITIAGFCIITFSFLKMVLTLLYLTFPTLFDKIDAHQKTSLKVNLREASPVDIISYVFALIMPNVKSYTDYANEDNTLDLTPLDYLKKRAPSLIFFIIIGAMIFDGQARSFMAKAADVGLFFGSVIEKHDTVGAVQAFVDSDGGYTYGYDTSTQAGKNNQKIANKVSSALRGINPNMKGEDYTIALGQLTEKVTTKVKADIVLAGTNAKIASYSDIVSFSISAQVSAIKPSTSMTTAKGSGVLVVDLAATDKKSAATVLQTKTDKKYLVIKYSSIRDKDNRNVLFQSPTTSGGN